jgi:GH24 family phage-related lysozyme (muramidase)
MYDFLDPSIDRRLAADIDASERNELTAYEDSLGNWTCGRGHLMPRAAPGRSWAGFTVIESTSDRWFCQDLLNAIALAKKWPEYQQCDTQARINALVEIAFNMGGRWDAWGPTRTLITEQNWQGVHDHLLNSKWASEIQPHHYLGHTCTRCGHADAPQPPWSYCTGLVNGRATRIANQFLKGEYDQVDHGT